MAKPRKNNNHRFVLPLFVIASAIVFSTVFVIVLLPGIISQFGYEPVLILLLITIGVVSSMLSILFYLLLKREIKI
ncbi:MAG: hypothetical protein HYW24_00805 [Candidatus Aenigmarchaeota archaeon]|nr:hypothetical protein [Candidatus Aenigmarchaeota archaeon]